MLENVSFAHFFLTWKAVQYVTATYSERKKTVGENRIIFDGRTIENKNRSFAVSPESSLDLRLGFPVLLRRRFALRSRIAGA